jgi:hypothetical protein
MELILNHNKSTGIDYFIFFPCRSDHNKVTQKFSPFYPTPLITYEIGNKKYHLINLEKENAFLSSGPLPIALSLPRPNSLSLSPWPRLAQEENLLSLAPSSRAVGTVVGDRRKPYPRRPP